MNKKQFIAQLETLLKIADESINSLELSNDEIVTVTYSKGGTKKINIACDSKLAIIEDVVRRCLW